jgi:hypothetical protein
MMSGNIYDYLISFLLKKLIRKNKKEWVQAKEKWNVDLDSCV